MRWPYWRFWFGAGSDGAGVAPLPENEWGVQGSHSYIQAALRGSWLQAGSPLALLFLLLLLILGRLALFAVLLLLLAALLLVLPLLLLLLLLPLLWLLRLLLLLALRLLALLWLVAALAGRARRGIGGRHSVLCSLALLQPF